MRTFVALAVFAVVGLIGTGCGSAKKVASTASARAPKVVSGSAASFESITVAGTATLPNAKTGVVITCKGGRPSAKVPGATVSVGSSSVTPSGSVPSSSRTLQVTRLRSGWVTVSCLQ